MVLTAAFEFDPRSNKEATIRPTDNIEVPQVKYKPFLSILTKSGKILSLFGLCTMYLE